MLLFKYFTYPTVTSKSLILSDSKLSIHFKDTETFLLTTSIHCVQYIRQADNYNAVRSADA